MSKFLLLIRCLPEILTMLSTIEKTIEGAKTDTAVAAQVIEVTNAFANKDTTKLNDILAKLR